MTYQPKPSAQQRLIAAQASILSAVMRDRTMLCDLAHLTPEHFTSSGASEAWRRIIDDPSIRDGSAIAIAVPNIDPQILEAIALYHHGRETVMRARDVLVELYARHRLTQACRQTLAELDNDKRPITDLILAARGRIGDIDMATCASSSGAEIARSLENQTPYNAIPTGIRALDYCLYGGLHVAQMTAVLARYKVGKSVLMATIARNLEAQGIPTLMVSLERQRGDIERFIVARALNIDARDLNVSDPAQRAAYDQYLEDPRTLRYVHRPGISIDELRATIIGEVQRHGIKVALIDYWQLITAPNIKGGREERQAEAGQMIANTAAELDIAALVTAQLSADGTPRGSEGLLASAGIVVKLNRPDNADEGFLQTVVSNKGKPLDKGSPVQPSIELALPGPHFRDYRAA